MVSEGKLSYPDKIHICIQTLSIHTRMFSPTDMTRSLARLREMGTPCVPSPAAPFLERACRDG